MKFLKNPKQLILIDILGASVTTVLLFIVVKNFNQFFGVDIYEINTLAIIALSICCFGVVCWFTNKKFSKPLLYTLAIFNLLYCLITIIILNSSTNLTIYGVLYFTIEVVIIISLAFLR
ncbi:hypothetical protein GCM10023230_18920 [Flavobacterium hankyongi]|uniref:Transporter n=1 Tax=Flavobacterium hankyongi TaxID=1176532 RepID=A0ABP8ZYE5_9FLAO